MTQPHLLELAKQGDPHAIATLMNVTLEPQGVTAKAFADVGCLSVFLSAARPLNPKTLVAFVQRGILRLEVSSIQQVQVYGQRLGEEQPAWVETFAVKRSQTAEALESPSKHSKAHASKPNVPDNASKSAVTHSSSHATRIEAWMQLALKLQGSLNRVATLKQTVRLPWDDRFFKEASPEAPNAPPKNRVNYLKLSALVTLAAFVTGGAVALIANSYTVGSAERTGGKPSAIAAGSQMSLKADAERTRNQQQTAARNYLETMNKAQQAFYRQNKRFAATLEELERFAAAPIATRSDYVYKLTVSSKTQSQLTAVPKPEGLKSYTAAVAIAPTNQVVAKICPSQQAAKVPPLIFQSPEGAVQCPQ